MILVLRTFKTEIKPNEEQKIKIRKTIGVARFVYNFYIAENQRIYEEENSFLSANDFSKYLNRDFIPNNKDYYWIKEVSSKSTKESIRNAETSFKRFFNRLSGFPRFKKKNKSNVKMYFVKNNDGDCVCERHRIKVPTLGWVRLKEKGYIPTSKDDYVVKSGTISHKAGRYYISCLVDIEDPPKQSLNPFSLGIDLGLEKFAVTSNGNVYKNINKTSKIKKLETKLKREQHKLSKKYEYFKNNKKGGATHKNIDKQILKVQKLHKRIDDTRTNYINKIVNELVKTKPTYITIEDLNVSGMMKNRYLAKAIASQKFYEFRAKLKMKCEVYGIELRIANRFYPSSKTCHNCGYVKKDLKLSDRVYVCKCGYKEDRDLNASLNLRDTKSYVLA